MAVVVEKTGDFVPSLLQTQLQSIGLPVLGVSAITISGQSAVQIVCSDGVDTALVDAVCANYVPPAQSTALAWVALRYRRNLWLNEIQYILDEVKSPGQHALPAQIASDIANNAAAWSRFAQTLRDLPANTPDPGVPAWPTPPALPVVFLT